ncbi:microsomal glutathione s-transferase [Grosmannia clavigera kw1407]|uniref:Microsomal glutathione s-transferase n=1 Tax=Grosmannia clavigera (strain kw1407 / UAMH 11150) TaxID=655863 RepID=F0XM86_GROCL|nr:microsomal glutathione s-transferase [Grosmannia clavigera kw1407]EFX01358.1 microsomal glutathione s-transferase [Grosmannia clavigera kw1407]
MSIITLELPASYGYVLLTATASFFVNSYHSITTGKVRKAAEVPYPVAYVPTEVATTGSAAYKFNCAQKAHANFTENHTSFLGALLISGLRFPLVSAGLGACWVASRVLYCRGYVKSGPKGRMTGAGASLFDLVLKFVALYTSVTFILEK